MATRGRPAKSPLSRPGAGVWVTARRRLMVDRAATLLVTIGGVAIIASILAILAFILIEVLPLGSGASVGRGREVELTGENVQGLVANEYRTHAASLGRDGVLRVTRLSDGRLVKQEPVLPVSDAASADSPPIEQVQVAPGSDVMTASTTDGQVILVLVGWHVDFEGQRRVVNPAIDVRTPVEIDPAGRPVRAYAGRLGENGDTTVVAQLADGGLVLMRRQSKENLFTGEVTESEDRETAASPGRLTHLVLDDEQRNLYGGNERGELFWWRLASGLSAQPQVVSAGDSAVKALSLLLGGRSLVVGQENGSLSIWFPVRRSDREQRLTRIRDFPAHAAPIRLIAPSRRDKGFLALDRSGTLGLYFSTSHRVLWKGAVPIASATALSYAPKANGAYLAGDGRLAALDIDNPHPEISLRSLFGPVWYEGYPQPEYVWQSSSGTDDFEPKLSLTPLLVGTLKGTVYSLLIAIPLAVFGAMYTSQFMHPSLKRVVKPTVEIMAALPSVVLGFLAGLWLAPRIERTFPALILMVLLLPVLTIGAGGLWQLVPRRLRSRWPVGSEAFLFLIVLAIGVWVSLQLNGPFEAFAFGGDFQSWLFATTGWHYDQRNAVIVGLAMGFAVIPIIFAIAEDAFSNVPRDLISGSLALGANRWQTVTRVVFPTASPGIFSAIMVGFGRAVGETMIVLMATGNTPILDWNPFNGFRTLSANIAVEIPEAPQFGTLYRVLFLAALLLFVVTFVVNTAAELVRQRLRRRFAQL